MQNLQQSTETTGCKGLTRTLDEALLAEMLRIAVLTTGAGAATKAASDSRAVLIRPLIVVLGFRRSAADSTEARDSIAAVLGGGEAAAKPL